MSIRLLPQWMCQSPINGLINKWTTMRNNLDEMCKLDRAYCDQPDHKLEPEDLTSSTLGLSTPE